MPDLIPMQSRWSEAGDTGLVMSSWMRSWKRGPNTKRMDSRAYWDYARALIEKLLKRDDVKLRIAHAPHDVAEIYGWMCWSVVEGLAVVHYAYTKQEARKRGVMRRLATEAGISPASTVAYTFRSPATAHIVGRVAEAEYYPVERFVA